MWAFSCILYGKVDIGHLSELEPVTCNDLFYPVEKSRQISTCFLCFVPSVKALLVTLGCFPLLQAAPFQLPALRLPPGLAVRLAAAAAHHRAVHVLLGACQPAWFSCGGGSEEGLCLLW